MGLYTKSVLFCFLNFALIHGQNHCPSSHCGSGNVAVQYPFKFESETPSSNSINCTYFNLSCNKTASTTLVNLPHAGDFYVQKIDYAKQYIQLYDPGNCLMRRLFDLSLHLQSSPFMAEFDNYTFYLCPLNSYTNPIHCMSNSTNITVVTRESSLDDNRCTTIASRMLPVELDDTFFYLSWGSDHCMNCERSGGWGSNLIAKLVALALTLPGLTIMSLSCCSIFCFHVMKMIGDRYGAAEAAPTATATAVEPSTTVNTGLDESKIVGCTELVVVRESDGGIPSSTNSKMCSICLENYSEKETVSVISKCGHCFHANCIHQWLGKNATCPVCRTSLSDFVYYSEFLHFKLWQLVLTPPFKLQNTQTQDNYTYVDLKCNATLDNGTATLSLPDAGDFYVHDIAYNDLVYGPNIQLYDPGNCLMKRLMNTNLLLPAPLQAIRSQNYTFYTCPVHVNLTDCNPIHCLSNSTNITIATASLPIQEELKEVGVCEVIGSWVLPESEISQFELGAANAHLYLTWDDLTDCPPQYTKHTGGFKDKSSANYDPSPYMSGLVAILCSLLITRVGGSQ